MGGRDMHRGFGLELILGDKEYSQICCVRFFLTMS